MDAVALSVITLGIGFIAASIAWHLAQQIWAARLMVRRRVLVNLIGGQAINGVLWTRRGRLLVLRDAQLLEAGTEPTRMDGDVVVDRDQVHFVQVAG